MVDMEITTQVQNAIKSEAQGWTEGNRDADGKNSTIYHPDLGVVGEVGTSQAGEVINPGKVVDVDAAHDIANTINEQGQSVGLVREKELQRQAETGMTEEERKNVELMEGVKNKYPDATIEKIDEKGRQMLFLNPKKYGETGSAFLQIMNQFGVFTIDLSVVKGAEKFEEIDWTEANDFVQKIDFSKLSYPILPVSSLVKDSRARSEAKSDYMSISKFDFTSENSMRSFSDHLKNAQILGEKKKELEKNTREVLNVETILGKL